MRVTEEQLRRIIREACALEDHGQEAEHTVQVAQPTTHSGVPSPQDYSAVREFMNTNPDIVDLGINMVMDLVGASCERSTAQAIIDHLQGLLKPQEDEVMFPDQEKSAEGPEALKIEI